MNLIVFIGIMVVLAFCIVYMFYCTYNVLIGGDILNDLLKICLLSIVVIVIIYESLSYLGFVGIPIRQGVFKSVEYEKESTYIDTSIPILDLKHPTDKDRYNEQVKQYKY